MAAVRRALALVALIATGPASACALHAGYSMGGMRYGGFGLFDHEATADDIPQAALAAPQVSREEAMAALRAQLLAQAPGLRPQAAPAAPASTPAQ
jgi:hypothetical protein